MRRHHYPSELRYAGPGDLPRQAAPTGDGVDADRRQQQERGHHVPHVGAVALKAMPLSMAAMTSPPSTAWTALPRPPNKLVPPMTAAATAYRTSWPPSNAVETERRRDAPTMPAIPAVNEASTNATVRILAKPTPARRAASALPPMAYL